MMDHHSRGQVLLPAVEAMEILATEVQGCVPGTDISVISNANFDRFIAIEQGEAEIEARTTLRVYEDETVRAVLSTRTVTKSGIIRVKEHITMTFGPPQQSLELQPVDRLSGLHGVAFDIAASDIYRDLVPFGPAFQNLTGTLYITPSGALGSIQGGAAENSNWPLGSPFPMDAAFHAACAWGQRYHGLVGFPVALGYRKIFQLTSVGGIYYCRVFPVSFEKGIMTYDIYIYDEQGVVYEQVLGVVMKDVSAGKLVPPEWVRKGHDLDLFPEILQRSRAFSVMERKTLLPFAGRSLSVPEQERSRTMGQRRIESFVAGRLCCKDLCRQLAGGDYTTGPGQINTIDAEGIRPRCPDLSGDREYACSLSHDKRFACAVAAEQPVGIDVEHLSDRVLKGQHFYMTEEEQRMAGASAMGAMAASLRVWSIKECVAKALDLKLVEAWRSTEVTQTGEKSSRVMVRGREYSACHDQVDDHLFTLLVLDD